MLDGQSVLIYVFHNIFIFSKLEVSLPFIVSLITVWLLEKNIITKLTIFLCLISISLTTFFIMYGLVVRVEMIHILIYFYIISISIFLKVG